MTGIPRKELIIEAGDVVEKLSGKRFFTVSTTDPLSDIFIETDGDRVEFKIAALWGRIVLLNRGKEGVATTGLSILRKIYISSHTMALSIQGCPVIVSVNYPETDSPVGTLADSFLYAAATACFLLSILASLPVKKVSMDSVSPRGKPLTIDYVSDGSPARSQVNFFALKETLFNLEEKDRKDLEHLLKSLTLSRLIYERSCEIKNHGAMSLVIGALKKRLRDMKSRVSMPDPHTEEAETLKISSKYY
ncbi:MAG: hypothetical protein GTN70_11285 [Deltaproteobacteria bacterium]|nr:hypothetical protein [Deltaproteobacteria bacterium]NIS78352.1 hypothetical protein [Deltaproteobacteria bacterium]